MQLARRIVPRVTSTINTLPAMNVLRAFALRGCTALTLLATPTILFAQAAGSSHVALPSSAFAVAFSKQAKYGTDVVIVRRTSAEPHDVVLLGPLVRSPKRVADALATLQAIRQSDGLLPSRDVIVKVPSMSKKHKWDTAAISWIQDLGKVEDTDLPGYGRVKWITINPRQD